MCPGPAEQGWAALPAGATVAAIHCSCLHACSDYDRVDQFSMPDCSADESIKKISIVSRTAGGLVTVSTRGGASSQANVVAVLCMGLHTLQKAVHAAGY